MDNSEMLHLTESGLKYMLTSTANRINKTQERLDEDRVLFLRLVEEDKRRKATGYSDDGRVHALMLTIGDGC